MVMTPRIAIQAVPVTAGLDDVLSRFTAGRHHRLLVYADSLDDILGAVHLRDLIEGESPPAITIPTPGPEAPTRISIPAINVDALVVEGDLPEQLKLGVGHYLGSANPGERGNMVLSAHDDIYGEIFRRLHELELGDEIVVYAGKQPYRYLVTAKQIVEPTEVRVLGATTKPVTTLITCYPYMVDTHRVVVVAELQ